MSRAEDFWSRRKAGVRQEEAAEAHAIEARQQAERERELEARTDDEILQDLGLPDPDTLEPGDDFGAFMARAVPERLRRRALRRLWLSNPALANLDGLVDYGEDYTNSATVIENLQTAYQVGQGMVARVEELAGDDILDAEVEEQIAQPVDAVPEQTEPEPETVPDEPVQISDEPPTETVAGAEPMDDETCAVAMQPRRRMQFHFQDQSQDRPGGQA